MAQITVEARTPAQMRATASYLTAMAGIIEMEAAARPGRTPMGGAVARPPTVIAPEDRPDVGAPLPPAPVAVAAVPAPVAAAPDTSPAAAAAAFSAPSVPVPPSPAADVPAAPSPASATAVPPAPPAAAPAPSAGGSVNAAGKQLDGRGLPWDSRIHSTPATLTDKGVWRKRRGLNDEALVQRIEAELRAGQAVPAPVAAAATPAVPVPPAPASAATPTDLPSFMQACAPMLGNKQLDMPRVMEACKAAGVDSLNILASRPDLVPNVWAEVQKRVAVPT